MSPFLTALLCFLFASAVSGRTLGAYSSDSCSGSELFEFQGELDTCYNNPVIGTCDDALGCDNTAYFGVINLNEILNGLNCTSIGDSFMVESDGTYHRWSEADCEGLEVTGPLNNPCLPLHICGSDTMDLSKLLESAGRADSAGSSVENWWSA